jgi:hypothetical protein
MCIFFRDVIHARQDHQGKAVPVSANLCPQGQEGALHHGHDYEHQQRARDAAKEGRDAKLSRSERRERAEAKQTAQRKWEEESRVWAEARKNDVRKETPKEFTARKNAETAREFAQEMNSKMKEKEPPTGGS